MILEIIDEGVVEVDEMVLACCADFRGSWWCE